MIFAVFVLIIFSCTKNDRDTLRVLCIEHGFDDVDIVLFEAIFKDYTTIRGKKLRFDLVFDKNNHNNSLNYDFYDFVVSSDQMSVSTLPPFKLLSDGVYFIARSEVAGGFNYPDSFMTLRTGVLYNSDELVYITDQLNAGTQARVYYESSVMLRDYRLNLLDIIALDRNYYFNNYVRIGGEVLFYVDTDKYSLVYSNKRALLEDFKSYTTDISPFNKNYWFEYFNSHKRWSFTIGMMISRLKLSIDRLIGRDPEKI